MTKRDILFLCFLVILVLFWIIPLMTEDPNTCPAPEDLETMEVYHFLRKEITSDMTPEQIIDTFARMCEIDVDCLDDRILVESYHWEGMDYYNIHLVRQFQFSDSTEFVQLHLDIHFSLEEMEEHPQNSGWYVTSLTDIRKLLSESSCFEAVEVLMPLEVHVSIDWTW